MDTKQLESFGANVAGISPSKWLEIGLDILPKIIGVLLLIFAASLIASYGRRATLAALQRAHFDPTLTKFFSNLVRWGILIVAGISVLGVFGVQATSFAAVIAAAGLAVGLAFQGTLSNFASGVMLLVFRPFRVNDIVKVAGQIGRVDEIDLFTMTLDTPDGRRIIIPNTAVFGTTIENMTFHARRRVDVDLQVDVALPDELVQKLLMEAASGLEGATPESRPEINLVNVGMANADWRVSVWVSSINYDAARARMLARVKLVVEALKAGRTSLS